MRIRNVLAVVRVAFVGALLLILLGATCFAQSTPSPASRSEMATPAPLSHDQHDKLTISVDPYTDSTRAKEKFGKANPLEAGILPVEVFLRNDSDQPMRVELSTVQLEVNIKNGTRQEVDWLRPEEVANLMAHPTGSAAPQQRRLPIPIVTSDKKAEKLAAILRPLTLDADVVPPKASIHGFLYFNVSNDMSVANTSSLYVPDVAIAPANTPLVFFEVPLRSR